MAGIGTKIGTKKVALLRQARGEKKCNQLSCAEFKTICPTSTILGLRGPLCHRWERGWRRQDVCAKQDERAFKFLRRNLFRFPTAGENQFAPRGLERTPLRVSEQSDLPFRLSCPAAIRGDTAFSKTAHPAV